jgi:CheY-like chemotaxis protein
MRVPALVLLVDDEEDQRELYRQYLEYQGFRVEVAQSGFEALEMALALNPDVVVMDLAMPSLDGFETTRRLKELKNTGSIPVVALTAHGDLPREWASDAGCDAFLTKPAFPHELEAAILHALAQTRGG